ncbi:MerR family transcriptional regulator [Paracoccus sp. MBLB3053]|uniref:MerR family transcriptional regulator n=1 Tax=Paracoccus aurantius TaxID=3073814 RepID=A0ABU2HU27_9RHOB|nr:MerR family transcriptional regulator [Paracoccus sp. MBLB3053]MDS9468556.1 MerR family transcriptional regulator [Paracoccus sp. MBLB3053]
MDKSPDAFRSIGEVSRLVGVAPHVLRYWETQFSQLSPVKRGDGRRYYRPDDVRLVAGLCQVMREEGLSIRGAKRLISSDRGAELRRIGEIRLGDAMRDSAPETERRIPAHQPADQLALPDPAASALAKPQPPRDSVAVNRAAARKRNSGNSDSLPLFADHQQPGESQTTDGMHWLGRIARAAQIMRGHEARGASLHPRARNLRELLSELR